MYYVSKIVLTFHSWNKLYAWSQTFWKFLAFSLEFLNFSRSPEQFFLTVVQNNFGNKIPWNHGFYDLKNPMITFPPHSILSLTKNYCRSLHVLKFLVLIYLSVLKSKKNWRIPVVKPTSRMTLPIWTISKRNLSPA